MDLPRAPRLVVALAVAFVLIYMTNSAPQYFGPLEETVVRNEALFVGASLIVISSFFLWRGRSWRLVQSRTKFAWFELVEAGLLALAVTACFGIVLTPFNLCIGGGGGFACYPDISGFLRSVLNLAIIVLSEELFFRAYLMNELSQILDRGVAAVLLSTLIYSAFHLPALQAEGFGTIALSGFVVVLVGAISLSACYWYTGRNLTAVILLHAYWDGVGALVLVPNYGQYDEIVLILGQLSLPVAVLVITHRLWPTVATRLRQPKLLAA
ncbi:MAG TPA: CPBP family intramembrane glutamic endopeptidase [Nitrososphaerales archaeon]|nr:CPBP family intramembrane glutamic endopeptidase [Nitrososphaerales archaeon]